MKLKTSHKLIAGFVINALLAALIGFFGFNGALKFKDSINSSENYLLNIESLLTINKDVLKIRTAVRSLIISNLPDEDRNNQLNNINEALQELEESWKSYESTPFTPEERLLWDNFIKAYQAYKKGADTFLDMEKDYQSLRRFNVSASANLFEKMKELTLHGLKEEFTSVNSLIIDNVDLNKNNAHKIVQNSFDMASSMETLIVMITIVIFITAIFLGIYFARTLVTKPMKALFSMFDKVKDSSKNLLQVSEHTASASTELSAQTSTSASSSEEVSSNISTVSSAAEEMVSSIREIANNTSSASKITKEAMDKANNAGEIIITLALGSNEIGTIVKSIISIAEQTNLLALNATIEAARAGESGKGFAVVANEVKDLAKEAARASEDITKRIKSMQDDSENSVNAIQSIIDIMKQVNDMTNSIAGAVEEQTVTVNEINRNLSEATRGSTSIAEGNANIASASEDYSKLAIQIKNFSTDIHLQIDSLESELKSLFII